MRCGQSAKSRGLMLWQSVPVPGEERICGYFSQREFQQLWQKDSVLPYWIKGKYEILSGLRLYVAGTESCARWRDW